MKDDVEWNMPKLKTKTWLKIYCLTTLVLIIGLGVTVGLMFNYMKTVNNNAVGATNAANQADNDVQQTDKDVQSTDSDVQNTDSDVQNVCNAISGC